MEIAALAILENVIQVVSLTHHIALMYSPIIEEGVHLLLILKFRELCHSSAVYCKRLDVSEDETGHQLAAPPAAEVPT